MSAKKIWRPQVDLDEELEAFTVGKDYLLDRELVVWDCAGSMAHATMLHAVQLLDSDSLRSLMEGLKAIILEAREGKFEISREEEDVHAAVEARLTDRLGDPGKKLHTGRSRNDQVLVDLRLFTKVRLLELEADLLRSCEALLELAERHKDTPMVGRTHMQPAMPSSVGLWAGAILESLLDDALLLGAAYALNDQCPLGSAASFGVPLPIDREMCARLLGFSKVQNNVLYANTSRGKIESVVLSACVQIMEDLSRWAQDVILFSMPEFGYFTVPQELCTGSSIMPQKRNPDALELTRARAATVMSHLFRILEIVRALPSGYNRDGQETKEPLLEGLRITVSSVRMMEVTARKLQVNRDRLLAGFTPEVFATDRALELAASGVPFREAYEEVKRSLDSLRHVDPEVAIKARTHVGASGNLGLDLARQRMRSLEEDRAARAGKFWSCMEALTGVKLES
jgi:argininosuccinate lyase